MNANAIVQLLQYDVENHRVPVGRGLKKLLMLRNAITGHYCKTFHSWYPFLTSADIRSLFSVKMRL